MLNGHAVGVDSSEDMVAHARASHQAPNPEAVGKDGSILVPCVGLDVEAFRPSMG